MTYTLKDWEKEEEIRKISYHEPWGSCRLPCPNCRVVGFYAPRGDNEGRRYRACKFCGFWQEARGKVFDKRGGEPYRCEAVLCPDCGIFDWHINFVGQACNNKNCKGTNKTKCPWAIDCLAHPFWQIKRELEKCTKHK